MRPPSRHKDLPQGLDLPPNDEEGDIPSLDSDSDSLDEFEIGIQNAQSQPKGRGKKQMTSLDKRTANSKATYQPYPLNDQQTQGLNRDSSDEDEEAQACESELLFTDNPTLKDFLNLSNGGSRFIKATTEARRGTGPTSINQKLVGAPIQSQKVSTKNTWVPQSYTANNFYINKGKTPTQAALAEAVVGHEGANTLNKPKSAAGNRVVSK